MTTPVWLPPLVPSASYVDESSWDAALYQFFLGCFIQRETKWRGLKVIVMREPLDELGRLRGYRHLTTVGEEPNRRRDWARCERLLWVKAVIEADPAAVATWRQDDGHIGIALPDFDYVVFLRVMPAGDAVFLLSAYPKESPKGRDKLRIEYERCKDRPLPPP